MRRIQIYIEDELDERLKAEAVRLRRSKASLIRESVAARYGEHAEDQEDPLSSLAGTLDVEPADVDEVVYPTAAGDPDASAHGDEVDPA